MKTKDICQLPVADISGNNCALILWVTFPRLKDGLEVMESWGFRYVTVAFNWFKTNCDGSPGKPHALRVPGKMKTPAGQPAFSAPSAAATVPGAVHTPVG